MSKNKGNESGSVIDAKRAMFCFKALVIIIIIIIIIIIVIIIIIIIIIIIY